MALLKVLLGLEEKLLALGTACDRGCAESLLTPEFREFGAYGRVLNRAAVLEEIADAVARRYTLTDARCEPLGSEAALLTYRVVVAGRESLRSSLWVRHVDGWQMLFHQGTRVQSVDVSL